MKENQLQLRKQLKRKFSSLSAVAVQQEPLKISEKNYGMIEYRKLTVRTSINAADVRLFFNAQNLFATFAH
jgi:hypothetical protein